MTEATVLFSDAKQVIPGGVNSPVRSFSGVGGTPVFIDHASGAYIFDSSGNRYIDYVGSWGPMILGHAHPEVIDAVKQAAEKGLSFGAPTKLKPLWPGGCVSWYRLATWSAWSAPGRKPP